MKSSYGFSLIECLIYLVLSAFVTILTLQTFALLKTLHIACLSRCHDRVAFVVGLDTLIAELEQAPAYRSRWTRCDSQAVRFIDSDGNSVALVFSKNKLMRVARSRQDNGILKNPSYSIIMPNVTGEFSVSERDGVIRAIQVSLTFSTPGMKEQVIKRVRPRAGVLL